MALFGPSCRASEAFVGLQLPRGSRKSNNFCSCLCPSAAARTSRMRSWKNESFAPGASQRRALYRRNAGRPFILAAKVQGWEALNRWLRFRSLRGFRAASSLLFLELGNELFWGGSCVRRFHQTWVSSLSGEESSRGRGREDFSTWLRFVLLMEGTFFDLLLSKTSRLCGSLLCSPISVPCSQLLFSSARLMS